MLLCPTFAVMFESLFGQLFAQQVPASQEKTEMQKSNKCKLFLEIQEWKGRRAPEGRHQPSPNGRWTEGRAKGGKDKVQINKNLVLTVGC